MGNFKWLQWRCTVHKNNCTDKCVAHKHSLRLLHPFKWDFLPVLTQATSVQQTISVTVCRWSCSKSVATIVRNLNCRDDWWLYHCGVCEIRRPFCKWDRCYWSAVERLYTHSSSNIVSSGVHLLLFFYYYFLRKDTCPLNHINVTDNWNEEKEVRTGVGKD